MKPFAYVMLAMMVMGLASWAYRENYETRAAIDRVMDLNHDIADLRETLGVLRAEWAYLNRPDRLRELSDMNFDRLGLLPLTPHQFGELDLISEGMEDDPPIVNSIAVRGTLAPEAAQ